MSAMTTPVSSKSTWATNRLSPSPDGIGESQLTTRHVGVGGGVDPRLDLLAGVVRDHHRVDALGGGVGHGLDLPGRVLAGGRAQELGLGGAELLGRLLGALVGLVEHGDARALGQQDGVHVVAALDGDGLAGRAAALGAAVVRRLASVSSSSSPHAAATDERPGQRSLPSACVVSSSLSFSSRAAPDVGLCVAALACGRHASASASRRRSGRRSSRFCASTEAMSSAPITPGLGVGLDVGQAQPVAQVEHDADGQRHAEHGSRSRRRCSRRRAGPS